MYALVFRRRLGVNGAQIGVGLTEDLTLALADVRPSGTGGRKCSVVAGDGPKLSLSFPSQARQRGIDLIDAGDSPRMSSVDRLSASCSDHACAVGRGAFAKGELSIVDMDALRGRNRSALEAATALILGVPSFGVCSR